MKPKIFGLLIILVLLFTLPSYILAQDSTASAQSNTQSVDLPSQDPKFLPPPKQDFTLAKVLAIPNQGINSQGFIFQDLKLALLSDGAGTLNLVNGGMTEITPAQKVDVGDTVVLIKFTDMSNNQVKYLMVDKYRLPTLWFLLPLFLIIVLAFAGKKGVGSILGLIFSLGVISVFIIPRIIDGEDPLTVTFIGSIFILFISTYLAHGISKQTTVALISTFSSLIITILLAKMAVAFSGLAGLGDESAYSLTYGLGTQKVNIQGLLLSGIIIGTLGALNDVTTTQAATIFELFRHNASLNLKELFKRGLLIGKEHITSLINTLVLAYAGSSIAIFIFLKTNPQGWPMWMILNSEVLFDEIVKTITSTIGLILSVPIVTGLSAWYVTHSLKKNLPGKTDRI